MTVYSRRGLHGQVVDVLGRRIIEGTLTPGTVIDLEHLERDLNVSRTVLREAIKVLTAKGLLDARPRLGTFVLPRSNWNLLDGDVMQWRQTDGPDDRLFQELDEVRRVVEPYGARLAAERRTDDDLATIAAALDAMRHAGDDLDAHIAADLAFHRAVLAASQNELLERLEVVLAPALRLRDALAFHGQSDDSAVELHAAVYGAIEAGDPAAADAAMQDLLRTAAADTQSILATRGRRPRQRQLAPSTTPGRRRHAPS